MNLPAHIEKELRQICKSEGFSEVETIAVMEFLCEMAEIQKEIVMKKGFIFQDKKAA